MSDELLVSEETLLDMKARHLAGGQTVADLADPAEGDFGWGAPSVQGIVSRASGWVSESIRHNAEVAAVLQHTWDNFQANDDGAAELFGQV